MKSKRMDTESGRPNSATQSTEFEVRIGIPKKSFG